MTDRSDHPIPRRRWGIAVLLGVSVLFNYFDRLALSVAAPSLRQELHLDALRSACCSARSVGPMRCCKFRPA
jgi:ACS family D-galactonate transporter-like MFS transporter